MMPGHKINNAVFDLRFNSKTALLQENSSLGGFVKQGLMPVIDTVLSKHDRNGSIICIDKLVIDLGRLRYSDFKGQMVHRLRVELDAKLRSKIQHLQNSFDSRERIILSTRRDLELIEHFLLTGALPSSQNLKHGWRPDRRLQLVLRQERSDFLSFLQKNSHRPQVIQRLVRQFSAGTVRQVARLLGRAQSETALKAVDNILRRHQSRSPTGVQTAAFTELVWELLLDYFLQNTDSRFTTAKFVNWIAAKLEQRQGSIPEELTTILAEETSKQVLPEDLTSQPGPQKTRVPGKESRQIFKAYDLYEALRFYLRYGMMPWSAGNVSPNVGMIGIIEELKKSHPEKLLELSNDLQHDPDLCRRLAGHLIPPLMTQFITGLLTVISPGNHKDRLTFVQSINNFADRAADLQGYYADIVRNLVTRQPIDLKQLAARPGDPVKAEPADAAFNPGQDPDLIRAYLTTLLNTANKTKAHVSTFSRLMNDLEVKYPSEYCDYLAWLAEFPSLVSRAIEALETLPAEAEAVADEKIIRRLKDSLAAYQQQGDLESAAQKTPDKSPSTGKQTKDDESVLTMYLSGDPMSSPISDATARAVFKRMIRHGSDTLYASLRDHLKDKRVIRKMITLLSENWLTRVLAGLRPDLHPPVQTYADIIAEACYSTELFDRPEKRNTLKWEFIFTYLASYAKPPFRESDFIRRFVAFLVDNIRKMDKGNFTAVLSQNLTANIRPANRPAHLTVLRELGHLEGATEDLKIEHPANIRETAEDMIEEVAVQNAGMIVAAPYLPQLWNLLELIEDGQFKGLQAAERAVHLLQFMTDESTDSPEYQLVLNKILCGIKSSEPITGRIDSTAKEQEAVEGLIRGMITNWKSIGNTSVNGFRESFFQRRGRLTQKDDAWTLKVEQRAFDMLLDSIPWGFATIKHPWMERVVYVKWR